MVRRVVSPTLSTSSESAGPYLSSANCCSAPSASPTCVAACLTPARTWSPSACATWSRRASYSVFPPDTREIGPDSIVLALRSLFDPEAAADLSASFGLRIGEEDFGVEVSGGKVELDRSAKSEPAASIAAADAPTLAAVLTGQLALDDALASGALTIEGSKQAAKRFLRLFPMPEPCACAEAEEPETAAA